MSIKFIENIGKLHLINKNHKRSVFIFNNYKYYLSKIMLIMRKSKKTTTQFNSSSCKKYLRLS